MFLPSCGPLRPGEFLAAMGTNLFLPMDGDRTLPFGLLSIRDPKTGFSNARHQSAKTDMADMLRIVELFLGPLESRQRLGPYSGNTLRSRFATNGVKPLELASGGLLLGSCRPWTMATCCKGLGRWANRKMMDIYVQEVTALVYLKRVPEQSKKHVFLIADFILLRCCTKQQFSPKLVFLRAHGMFYFVCERDE